LAETETNFCMRCGTRLEPQPLFGRIRPACPSCGWIYFADPKVAVGVLVEREGEVLLVRRTNEPQQGRWSLPAGFLDAGELPEDAAIRECLEETGLQVRITGLHGISGGREHPKGADIVIVYLAEIVSGVLTPGDDADMAAFFPRTSLPELAFEATRRALTREPKEPKDENREP
jgi:ADP-ribose pyrophosphatase YjhB (NUDIX family)